MPFSLSTSHATNDRNYQASILYIRSDIQRLGKENHARGNISLAGLNSLGQAEMKRGKKQTRGKQKTKKKEKKRKRIKENENKKTKRKEVERNSARLGFSHWFHQ